MPSVSIIMNCRNGAKYLREALDSVYQQTFKDYEIIFWDNQSTDNSGEIARSYGKPLRCFRGEEYLPLGAARNKAIEQATGKYIAFLDCDDIWLPEKLAKQIELFESNKELGIVYADSYVINSNGDVKDKTILEGAHPLKGNAFYDLLQNNPIVLSTAVIKRAILDKVGVFNPKYDIAEEYDLWLRISEYFTVDFINQSLTKFRVHDESGYLKNLILVQKEKLQIYHFWFKKNPGLKKELGGKFIAKMYLATILAALSNVYKRKTLKSVAESAGLLKYLIFPK